MKSFLQFITEAPSASRAVEQAKRLGFVSDGHGNLYDREGNYKGHTEKGELVLAKARTPKKEDPQKQQAAKSPEAIMAKRRADDDLAGAPLQQNPEEDSRRY